MLSWATLLRGRLANTRAALITCGGGVNYFWIYPNIFLTYLRTEVLYLLRGVADHLDPVLVGGHAAGEVGNLHQLVSVLSKHASRLVNLTIVLLRYFSSE